MSSLERCFLCGWLAPIAALAVVHSFLYQVKESLGLDCACISDTWQLALNRCIEYPSFPAAVRKLWLKTWFWLVDQITAAQTWYPEGPRHCRYSSSTNSSTTVKLWSIYYDTCFCSQTSLNWQKSLKFGVCYMTRNCILSLDVSIKL